MLSGAPSHRAKVEGEAEFESGGEEVGSEEEEESEQENTGTGPGERSQAGSRRGRRAPPIHPGFPQGVPPFRPHEHPAQPHEREVRLPPELWESIHASATQQEAQSVLEGPNMMSAVSDSSRQTTSRRWIVLQLEASALGQEKARHTIGQVFPAEVQSGIYQGGFLNCSSI